MKLVLVVNSVRMLMIENVYIVGSCCSTYSQCLWIWPILVATRCVFVCVSLSPFFCSIVHVSMHVILSDKSIVTFTAVLLN